MPMRLALGGIVDPTLGALVEDVTVTIDGSKFVDVSKTRRITGEGVTDWSEFVAMPGLIDCHVHLAFDSMTDDCVGALYRTNDRQLLINMRARAQGATRSGITTLRDLGDRNYLGLVLREEAKARSSDLPTILSSGPPLTSPGGHCHFLGGETIAAEEALVASVTERWSRGIDVAKVMVTGGMLTPGSDPAGLQFDSQALDTIVRQARAKHLPIAAHAHTPAGIRVSVEAGVDSIEHCTFVIGDEFSWDNLVATALCQKQIAVCPTLVERPEVVQDADRLAWRKTVVNRLYTLGVPLISGTDAGVLRNLHHDSLPWAILTLANCGVSPIDCIRAATCRAARACGLGGMKGAIAPGLDADLVVLRANPLVDLPCILEPQAVVIRGRVINKPKDT